MLVHMLFAALITSILFAGGDNLWKTVQKVLYILQESLSIDFPCIYTVNVHRD